MRISQYIGKQSPLLEKSKLRVGHLNRDTPNKVARKTGRVSTVKL